MKTEKTMMKNVMFGFLLVALVVIGVVLISNKNSKIDNLKQQFSDLNTRYNQNEMLVTEMVKTFDEIEKSLTFISKKRSELQLDKKEGAVNEKEKMVADIRLMNQMLEESSQKIEKLEKKLNESGIENISFKKRIARLQENIEEQNESIEELQAQLNKKDMLIEQRDFQIAEMNEQLVSLENDISQKEDSIKLKSQMITEKVNELNKAYFASGTYKELKENGVVEKEGGILFLRKNKTIQEDLNKNYFTELDARHTDVFPIFSKKAEVISEHPDSSYSYIYDKDQIAYLKIENPEEFWKITKYAVIQVK
jgi:DNA repair exonuclease SbcCD ATPase subunit